MPNFESNALERRRDDCESGQVMRMAVAFDHLRRNWSDAQPKAPANFLFDLRSQVRARADCARNFANGHFLCRRSKTRQIAAIFVIPIRNLQAEGDGFRVNAMRAANLWNVLEFPGAPLEDFAEALDAGFNQRGSFAHK